MLDGAMSDVTLILGRIEGGDPSAARQLMPLVYEELRKLAAARLARERPDHTLQATALVHEAYLRLVGPDQQWESRGHFFAAAANSMRQILVDWARARKRLKRGGGRQRVVMDGLPEAAASDPDTILDLDEALTKLTEVDAQTAELVKLRLFAGLSVTEAGEAINLSRASAYENWQFARAWFAARELGPISE
jgi:RNA polymerase sigma factor (TIGR02999 family)